MEYLQVPAEIMAALEPIKDNEEAVRAYGIHLGTEMCKKILAHDIRTLHLYSLNLEKSVLGILQVYYISEYIRDHSHDIIQQFCKQTWIITAVINVCLFLFW